jgi:hypothetical protein
MINLWQIYCDKCIWTKASMLAFDQMHLQLIKWNLSNKICSCKRGWKWILTHWAPALSRLALDRVKSHKVGHIRAQYNLMGLSSLENLPLARPWFSHYVYRMVRTPHVRMVRTPVFQYLLRDMLHENRIVKLWYSVCTLQSTSSKYFIQCQYI